MPSMARQRRALLAGAAALITAACGGSGSTSATPGPLNVGAGSLTGAGATFPEPFYTKAFYAYSQKYSSVTINYQSVGSGGGIQQFSQGTVDFGASDVPMNDKEIQTAGGPDTLVQIPTALADAAVAYNLTSVASLNVDGPTLAGIYLGKIKKWNDPAVTAINAGASLPNKDITVVHRSDGSGTSYMFTDYLSKISDEWKSRVGVGKSVQWPAGVGGMGNTGVANAVKQTDGAIGYVELAYVVQTNMRQAALKNKAGKYLKATAQGATDAAAHSTAVSPTNFSITDAPGDTSFPLTTFSWIILRKSQADANKGRALVYLFKWLVTDGQAQGPDLQYAPLPRDVADNVSIATLKTITQGGKPILT